MIVGNLECNASLENFKKKGKKRVDEHDDFRLQLGLDGLVRRDYNADTS
jgi:hypothetical protein